MEIFGSPGSYIDLCKINSEKELGLWMTSSLKPSLYNVIRLLPTQQESWTCLKKHFHFFRRNYLFFCIKHM